jgi:DNA-binding transcriptional regulator GbsR (MarR family)
MRPEEQDFIEHWSRILAAEGLPPVAGRLWAWLLVCEPAEQTAEQIAHAIGASRGAISGAARMLEPSGLILRTKRRGDRREYWRSAPDAVIRVLEAKERQVRPSLDVLSAALVALADRPEASLQRLSETHALYVQLAATFPSIVAHFRAQRVALVPAATVGKD